MNVSAMAFAIFLGNLTNPGTEAGITQAQSLPHEYQVAFSNTLVDFEVQNNLVVPGSICKQNGKYSAAQKAECVTQAKNLFVKTCDHLSKQDVLLDPATKYTFCNAAQKNKKAPSAMSIVSTKKEDPAFLARQQCSEFTLRAQRTGSGVHLDVRDQVCKKARRLSRNKSAIQTLASR